MEKGTYDYDILIIGGGPGGYVAAIRAAQLGAKTAVVEKDKLGGTCLNRGCIPTKALLHSSNKYQSLRKDAALFGLEADSLKVDLPGIMKNKDQVVGKLVNGVAYLLKKNKVQVITGSAAFCDAHTVDVAGQKISADKIIIATGSVSRMITLNGDMSRCVGSDELLNLQELPKSLLIVGGGVIGVELASVYRDLGCEVLILEIAEDILLPYDREVVDTLKRQLKKQGIRIETAAKLQEVKADGEVLYENKAGAQSFNADVILLATGRKPDFTGLCPEKAGINCTEKCIPSDAVTMQTNQPHIYAIGDVTGGIQLAHFASAQGIVAVEHSMGVPSHTDMHTVPSCVYTRPELAAVGLTEEEVKQKGLSYKAAKFPMAGNGKSLITGAEQGVMKMLFNEESGEIYGMHMLADHATDMIGEVALAMSAKLKVSDIGATIHAHPTVSEAIMETAHVALGMPIHK